MHTEADKKSKKPSKFPDPGSYQPEPTDYALFSNIKKAKSNKNFLGNVDRFKLPKFGSGLAPGKYAVVQQWQGKEKKKVDRHGLEAISKGVSKSVYYH